MRLEFGKCAQERPGKKQTFLGTSTQAFKRTLRLIERLGPEGRVFENKYVHLHTLSVSRYSPWTVHLAQSGGTQLLQGSPPPQQDPVVATSPYSKKEIRNGSHLEVYCVGPKLSKKD